MDSAKLTLRPSKQVIELAHRIAAEEQTSITQMFTAFILARGSQNMRKQIPIGPLTRSVSGILKVPDGWDYKNEIEDILDEKYGIKQ